MKQTLAKAEGKNRQQYNNNRFQYPTFNNRQNIQLDESGPRGLEVYRPKEPVFYCFNFMALCLRYALSFVSFSLVFVKKRKPMYNLFQFIYQLAYTNYANA